MSRLKTIAWLLLIILLIGIVAIATRTPAVTGESPEEAATPAASADSAPSRAQSPSQ